MGLTAGLGFIICLRLLGVGRQIPVSSLRILFRVFWIGFYINLLSGTILFMTDATGIARVWELYAKLACLGLALGAMSRLRRFIDSDRSDAAIPPSVRKTAVACIVLWLAVIASGRLIAYAVERVAPPICPATVMLTPSELVHLHLLLNHFPTVGMTVGFGVFLLALVKKSEDLKRGGLAVLFVIALLSLPTYMTGYSAQKSVRTMPGVSAGAGRPASAFGAAGVELHGGDRPRLVVRALVLAPRDFSG